MGPQVVKVEDIDFATKITPPAASSSLDLIGYAPTEKLVRISIIKGIKGLSYGGALESSLRDRLVNNDKFEEEEEEALEKLVAFFQPHNLPKGANIVYHWPTPSTVQVSPTEEAKIPEEVAYTIDNANVVEALLDLYLGENTVTPSTLSSVAEAIAAELL